jgi:hypothetical protein
MPLSLKVLWDAYEKSDNFVREVLGFSLLTSSALLDNEYAEEFGKENPDIAANVRAHQTVFSRLGFFAADDNSGFLAFGQQGFSKDDPPVLELDSEGQYSWLGLNLSEAILRTAESIQEEDAAVEWLAKHGMPCMDVGEIGSSTQFLPSLADLHKRLYWQIKGEPRQYLPTPAQTASIHDPSTWLLRPGAEVEKVITALAGSEAKPLLQTQWVECDGDGRVCTVWLKRLGAISHIKVHGIGFGTPAPEVRNLLGLPAFEGTNWVRYDSGGLGTHFAFNSQSMVEEITLMDTTLMT